MTVTIAKLREFSELKFAEAVSNTVKVLNAIRRIAVFSLAHFLLLGGFAAMAYGAWLIWHPLGFIVGGWFGVKLAVLVSQE